MGHRGDLDWPKDDPWQESFFGLPAMEHIAARQLQAAYEETRARIAECRSIEELGGLAAKASAMESYAIRIQERTLQFTARRLHIDMVRKIGLLLLEFEPDVGGRPKKTPDGTRKSLSRTQAAEQAGLGHYHYRQALLIGRIASEIYEKALARPKPPTLEGMAALAHGRDQRVRDAKLACEKLAKLEPLIATNEVQPHDLAKAILAAPPDVGEAAASALAVLAEAHAALIARRSLPTAEAFSAMIRLGHRPSWPYWIDGLTELASELFRVRQVLGCDAAYHEWLKDVSVDKVALSDDRIAVANAYVELGRDPVLTRRVLEALNLGDYEEPRPGPVKIWKEMVEPARQATAQ